MTDFLWDTPGSLTAYLGATLNSLANATTDLGAAIDNSSARKTHMDLELVLASVDLSAQTNPAVEVYIMNSVDGGTVYQSGEDAKSAVAEYPSADTLLCVMGVQVETGAQAHNAIKTGLVIPPGHFKLLALNKLGVSMAAAGNTLKYRTYHMADV